MTSQQALELAVRHHQADRLREAESLLRQILAAEPANARALHLLGLIAHRAGHADASVALLERACELQPTSVAMHCDLGVALAAAGRDGEELERYREALELDGDDANTHNNFGNALRRAGRFEEAEPHFRKALVRQPRFVEALNNLANVLRNTGRAREAIDLYRKALALKPDDAGTRFNLSVSLLLLGDFEQGWECYESRPAVTESQKNSSPRWDGCALQGKRILLRCEQGLGDTIQFMRYVPAVAERGGAVVVQCQPTLKRLLARQGTFGHVIGQADLAPSCHFHCFLMSLARIFRTTLPTIPASIPYLRADPNLTEQWRHRMGANDSALRVGIAWAGSAQNPADRERSIPLQLMAPLAGLQDVRLFSLQKGPPADQVKSPPPGMKLIDLTTSLVDFEDTAALIENLDLVITADTAVAHLAGAMGKPTRVLLPFAPDWRWMLDRCDSPWYPTMRLFRQAARNDWQTPILQIAEELSRCQR